MKAILTLSLIFLSFFSYGQLRVKTGPSNKKIVFDGNSLFTRGNGNLENVFAASQSAYTTLTGARPAAFFVSISGRTITRLIQEFPTKTAPYLKPGDIVVNNEFVNELDSLQSVSDCLAKILQYRSMVQSLGCKLVLATVTAASSVYNYANFDADRQSLNSILKTNTSTYCDALADPAANVAFSDPTNTTYYNADKLHFTTAGYILYGQLIAPAIQTLLP